LRDAAIAHAAHAAAALGSIDIDQLSEIASVWRPLLATLAKTVPLAWRNPGTSDANWFPGQLITSDREMAADISLVSCANPRAEAVEALRWMRELIASGRATR
jgi:hypothetical protein